MTTDMHPSAHIVAYFYNAGYQEFVADGLTFTVHQTFVNDVRVQFDVNIKKDFYRNSFEILRYGSDMSRD